jgi:S-adenosyl-L-methionine hydrolase (adenosine-forming)
MVQTPLITLTTDFGTSDGYVGTMKGVILSIVPDARLVDLSHEVVPQDVRAAAYVLYTAYSFFPSHTVHLVVVDPGVGGARRPIALRTPVGFFVGPDNGVFSYVMACEPLEASATLTDPRYSLPRVSQTFHGRDVFAPVAAHLAAGVPITDLGPPVADPVVFPLPRLEITSHSIVGEVLHVDRFGNVVTSVGELTWAGDELVFNPAFDKARSGMQDAEHRIVAVSTAVEMAGQEVAGVRRTYTEVEPGEMLALVGSGGHLEIAVREGSAAERLGVHPGDKVVLRF